MYDTCRVLSVTNATDCDYNQIAMGSDIQRKVI